MNGVYSLIDGLYHGAVSFSVRIVASYVYADTPRPTVLPQEETIHFLPSPAVLESVVEIAHTPFLATPPVASIKTPLMRGMVMYAGLAQVPLYKNPTIEFDAQVASIPFGSMVMAGEPKGRFCPVTWNTLSGWVLRDDLADRATHIYPLFVRGEENTVDSPNTAQVRTIIGDVFGLARSEFSLQAGEYVLYRLWRKGKVVVWPSVRPRMPGMWHEILKGAPRVHMSLTPTPGAVIEFLIDGEIGHVAYVEAVFPDMTISISEVNNPDSGIYAERELTPDEWKSLRPVFIELR